MNKFNNCNNNTSNTAKENIEVYISRYFDFLKYKLDELILTNKDFFKVLWSLEEIRNKLIADKEFSHFHHILNIIN